MFKESMFRGAWLAQSVEYAVLHLGVVEFEPHVGHRDYFKKVQRIKLRGPHII